MSYLKKINYVGIVFLLFIWTESNGQSNKKDFFDKKDQLLFGGRGFSGSDNLKGNFAWGESYMLMSYFSMYEGTLDVNYLKKIADRSYILIEKNDLSLKREDFRGEIRPLWLSTSYSKNNEPIAWVVHTGMITYPILLFCHEVLKDQSLHQFKGVKENTLLEDAKRLSKEVQTILEAHDDEWDIFVGNYVFPTYFPLKSTILIGEVLPFNMFSAMGRSQLMMFKITGDNRYKNKVVKMAEFFKNELELHQEAYIWKYHPKVKHYEDISHGQIETHFAYLCYKNELVFNSLDMKRFARTFLTRIYQKEGVFMDRVHFPDSNITFNKYLNSIGGWFFLSEFDNSIYDYPLVYK